MEQITLETIINGGIAGILLFMYIRLEARFDKLQQQLHETNMRLWSLLEKELQSGDLSASEVRRINPPPNGNY